jgi:CRP-like cAMP-binding protein
MIQAPAKARKVKPRNAFEAPAEVCALLRSMGRRFAVGANTVLFRKGEAPKGVFLVIKGKVALSAGDDGSGLTRIAQRRSLLGLPSTVNNKRYSLTAVTLTDVELCLIQPQAFRNLLQSNPMVGVAIVKILSDEVWALRRFRTSSASDISRGGET